MILYTYSCLRLGKCSNDPGYIWAIELLDNFSLSIPIKTSPNVDLSITFN